MGRYNLSAQRVHSHATQLLQTQRIASPPPWYNVVGTYAPSERLVRPPLQRSQRPGKKASKLFKPLSLSYQEDKLRWDFFNDHPWELARPRVVLENDGRDHERWDWGHALSRPTDGTLDAFGQDAAESWDRTQNKQAGRPIDGESVVKRQRWLMEHSRLSESAAYDQARKEFYRARHAREVEDRVAKEEALAYGAYFDPGPNEIGMMLEDQQYEAWRQWAEKEAAALKQMQGSAYTGMENEESALEDSQMAPQELDVVSESVPGSKAGQTAQGGAAIHP